MLENCQTAKERWGGVNKIIDRWLEERQQLLVQYCALSGLESANMTEELRGDKVKELCQILVDYVSYSHLKLLIF